jgi:hypothetical protein
VVAQSFASLGSAAAIFMPVRAAIGAAKNMGLIIKRHIGHDLRKTFQKITRADYPQDGWAGNKR